MCQTSSVNQPSEKRGVPVEKISTVNIDLARDLLQIHAIDERGKLVLEKHLKSEALSQSLPRWQEAVTGQDVAWRQPYTHRCLLLL